MTVRISGATGGPECPATTPNPWGALSACLVAVFMQMLDLTIVHTAVPAVARDLRAGGSAQLLIVTGYGLAFACTLLTAARVGDLLGRRAVFLVAMTGFAGASLWCGLATGAVELVSARGVAGVAAAAASAQVIAIITGAFTDRGRTVAFGVYGAVAGLAGMAGPLVGGALVDADALGMGWRTIFLINVPLGGVAVLLGYRYVGVRGGRRIRAVEGDARAHTGGPVPAGIADRLDVRGALLSAVGLGLLVYPLTSGSEMGWPPGMFALLALSVPVLAIFVRDQRRRAASGAESLVRPQVFADRSFAVGTVLTAVFFGMFTALLFTVSVTVQTGLGWSASHTGLLMLPFAVGAIAGALSSPLLVSRWGPRALTLGVTVFAVALGALAETVHTRGSALEIGVLAWPVFAAGAGMGWFAAPLPSLMLAGVADRLAGSASGLVPTVQQVGSCLGAAVLGMVFFDRVAAQSYTAAITTVLWIMSGISAGLAVLTFALPRSRS
ncbi:MFS transporter [Nocardia jejuensis]|uniref:MFS transporter n=1 Tax=Nocardia jejuensis TaxID=328049 RepID=UPI00082B5E68|nr:MFS transporter [Nocardia jejuensis]